MRRVAVIGVGITKFGKHDRTSGELFAEAAGDAIRDADVAPRRPQSALDGVGAEVAVVRQIDRWRLFGDGDLGVSLVLARLLDGAGGLPGPYDLVTTFDCIHDMTDPQGMMHAIRGALRDDGTWLLVDIKALDTFEQNVAKNPLASLM